MVKGLKEVDDQIVKESKLVSELLGYEHNNINKTQVIKYYEAVIKFLIKQIEGKS